MPRIRHLKVQITAEVEINEAVGTGDAIELAFEKLGLDDDMHHIVKVVVDDQRP